MADDNVLCGIKLSSVFPQPHAYKYISCVTIFNSVKAYVRINDQREEGERARGAGLD